MINMEARTRVLHYPRLDTVLMVEEFIKEKGMTRQEFYERYGDLVEKIIK